MLISRLALSNCWGFKNFTLELNQFTVLAGLNNAGKTSILRAVPFAVDCISDAVAAVTSLKGPTNLHIHMQDIAMRHFNAPEVPNLLFRSSDDKPAGISLTINTPTEPVEFQLTFGSGSSYQIKVTSNSLRNQPLNEARILEIYDIVGLMKPEFIPSVSEIPPEGSLDWNSLNQNIASGRYMQTWRNRFHWDAEAAEPGVMNRVAERVRQSLPGIRLNQPRRTRGQGVNVDVSYHESGFDYDIGIGGAGLRTLVVLAAAVELSGATHLLLDEPDAHLHPGAQRDIAAFLAEQAVGERQIIVSTHAPDFIDAVPVDSLIWIDRNQSHGRQCDDIARVLVDLGAIPKHDALQFSGAKAMLFFEGQKDRRCFASLMQKCGMGSLWQKCRVEPLGGHGDGRHISPAIRLLKTLEKKKLAVVVIRDADYLHLEPKMEATEDEHVLDIRLPCKELENLFLDPEVIENAVRMVADRREEATKENVSRPSRDQITEKLDEYSSSSEMRQIVERQWVFRWFDENGLTDPGQLTKAYAAFENHWKDAAWRRRCCPGKEILKKLRDWLQRDYKLTIGNSVLLDAYQPDKDLKEIFARIDQHITRMTA